MIDEIAFSRIVHQEADRSVIYPVNRNAGIHHRMQRFQHHAIPAEGNDDVRIPDRGVAIPFLQPLAGILRIRAVTCHEAQRRRV